MDNLPSGTVTFLFTDIEGSTKLAQANSDKWEFLHARHQIILRSAVKLNNGYVFQVIGDAFCASFHTAKDGLNAAVEAQRRLHLEDWGKAPIKVRMGIHTGEAEIRGDDYRGYLTLVRVQRIMSAGHGGQVLVSGATENLLRGQLPTDISLMDLGRHNFKDVPQAVRVFQVIAPDLPQEFPPLHAFDILPNNLPTQLTSFVGREKELGDVKRLLKDTHMLTLIGPGGTGKTRLSIRVARDVLNQYPDGVWLIDLAPVLNPTLVPRTTAIAIGLREEPQRPVIDMLCDYLSIKKMLIILDNCEHLVDACAQMSEQILRTTVDVRILASSREALGVAGEVTYRVPSLGFPDKDHLPSLEVLNQYEAVKLFIDRATSALPSFTVTNENAPSLAQVCHRLDGIPLAIELAAAKIRVLSLEQIAKRLDDRFRLLTGGRRTALERHQTLRAAVDWSYNLLPPEEQTLFRRLSVFVGGWTLDATESICEDESTSGMIGGEDALNLLEQLINKSLVVAEDERGESRYRMLETMRQYASEKLVESGESDTFHERHLRFFTELAETAEPHLRRAEQLEWLSLLDVEIENLRTALDWSLDSQSCTFGLRLAGALGPYWGVREHFKEGIDWLESLLKKEETAESSGEWGARGKALLRIVELMDETDDIEHMLPFAEEAFNIYENMSESQFKALSFALLGKANLRTHAHPNGGTLVHARQYLEQSRKMFEQLNDPWGQTFTLEYLAITYRELGEIELLNRAYRELENLSHASGDRFRVGESFSRIAYWYFNRKDFDQALYFLDEADRNYEALGMQAHPLTWAFRIFIDYVRRDYEHAKTLFEKFYRTLEIQGNHSQRETSLITLSGIALYEGQPEIAIANMLKVKTLVTEGIDKGGQAFHNMLLGSGYYLKGEHGSALENFRSSLKLITEADDKKRETIIWALQFLSFAAAPKEPIDASRILGAAYATHESFSTSPFEPHNRSEISEILKARIGDDEFTRAFAEGEKMSIEEAIQLAKSLMEKL